jgi:hypothetical protein
LLHFSSVDWYKTRAAVGRNLFLGCEFFVKRKMRQNTLECNLCYNLSMTAFVQADILVGHGYHAIFRDGTLWFEE